MNSIRRSDSTHAFTTGKLEIGQGALLPKLFQLAPCDGIALVALTADWGSGGAFSSTHETGRAGNLVRTSLRPLTSSRKSGTAGAQPTGLGAHLVDASSNYGLTAVALSCFGSPTWARTRDLRINSPSLYRLSYRGSRRSPLVARQEPLILPASPTSGQRARCIPSHQPSAFTRSFAVPCRSFRRSRRYAPY